MFLGTDQWLQIPEIAIPDLQQQHPNVLIIRLRLVLQILNVEEDVLQLLYVLDCLVVPQVLARILQALVLYFCDVILILNVPPR